MADTGDDVLFQSPVEHENKPYTLLLTKYQLSWDATSKCKLHEGHALEPLIRKLTSLSLCLLYADFLFIYFLIATLLTPSFGNHLFATPLTKSDIVILLESGSFRPIFLGGLFRPW